MKRIIMIILMAIMMLSVFFFGYMCGDITHHENEMQALEKEIKRAELENLRLDNIKLEAELRERMEDR